MKPPEQPFVSANRSAGRRSRNGFGFRLALLAAVPLVVVVAVLQVLATSAVRSGVIREGSAITSPTARCCGSVPTPPSTRASAAAAAA